MTAKIALTCLAVALAGMVAVSSGSGLAQSVQLGMLDRLTAGDWEMRPRDQLGEAQRLCLSDARRLIQLRHQGQNCSRVIVEDTPDSVIVQYTCPGRGYGRTHIRRESDSLVQIDSQGIAQGLPFAFAAEARRVGACRR